MGVGIGTAATTPLMSIHRLPSPRVSLRRIPPLPIPRPIDPPCSSLLLPKPTEPSRRIPSSPPRRAYIASFRRPAQKSTTFGLFGVPSFDLGDVVG